MSVRIKTFGFIVLVFFSSTAVTWAATVGLVQAEYIKLEADNVRKDTARSVDALKSRVDQLALKVPDWSSWDDTYQFINDHNQDYIDSNVQNSALQNLTINFMLFINDKQQIIESVGVDNDTGDSIPLPPELLAALKPGSKLLAATPDDAWNGLLRSTTHPIIIVTRPILRTDGTGPLRGTLVFAQYLTPEGVAKLGDLTHLTVAYDPATSADGSTLTSEAAGTSLASARTQTHGSDTIMGYQLVNDIYGKPILIAHVTEPRSIYQETQRTLVFYLIVVTGVIFLSILVAIYTTSKIVSQDRTIKLKNEFFSIASHELRTPLWAMLGNSSMIQEVYGPKNDDKLKELASDIHEGCVRLIKIVTNFLDAARLEGGKMPIKIESIGLERPINAAVGELQALGKEKGLTIETKLPAVLPQVMADPEKVQQVIYNLIGNAMKFTDKGGITITAQASPAVVSVTVTDTGRGISKAGQQALFKSFQQTQAGDENMGSGLGLYISKLLVERMSGHIWLESSEEGKGTSIAFSLPVTPGHTMVGTPPSTPPATPPAN